jgi:hypothetical protein
VVLSPVVLRNRACLGRPSCSPGWLAGSAEAVVRVRVLAGWPVVPWLGALGLVQAVG